MKKTLLVTILLLSTLLFGCIQNVESTVKSKVKSQTSAVENIASTLQSPGSSLSGTYRCWSYNVQGAGKSCTSPSLVLSADGKYSMSSEQGTYSIDGGVITLSESKIRGPGKILENGQQIRFEYEYNDWTHVVTYAKFENSEVTTTNSNTASSSVKYVEVSLNMVFSSESEARSITTAALVAQGETQQAGEALVYESKPGTATALFRKSGTKSGIAIGKIYNVLVSNGFSNWKIGEVNLTTASDDVELEIQVKTETSNSQNNQQEQLPSLTPKSQEENNNTNTTVNSTMSLPVCNPNVPKYAQPQCRDE